MAGGLGSLRRWWANKYSLPPNHELFESQSIADLNLEMFEDLIGRKRELEAELEAGETKNTGALLRALNEINRALGEAETGGDPLVDKWERELAEGKIPDLTEGM